MANKAKKEYGNINTSLEKSNKEMKIGNEDQKVVDKNINASLTVKNKDNTVSFEKQLETARTNKNKNIIIESGMAKKEVKFGEQTDAVSAINNLAQKLYQEKADKIISAEKKQKKDKSILNKNIGSQLLGPKTKISDNVPEKNNQLNNSPETFENKKIAKSIKDADAMLFHIYASAYSQNRNLNDIEEQQVKDINSAKLRILAQTEGIKSYERWTPPLERGHVGGKPFIDPNQKYTDYSEPDVEDHGDGTVTLYEPGTREPVITDDGRRYQRISKSEAQADFPEAFEI